MISRLLAIAAVFVTLSSIAECQTKAVESQIEPGLTARIGSMALLKLPETAKTALSPQYLSLIERLQVLPVVPNNDPEGQLKLIFAQVKDHTVSPELLVSAARAVNAILLTPGADTEVWSNFRNAIVLRSQYSDLDIKTIPSIADITVFSQDLKKEGEALKAEAAVVAQSQDGVKMTDMRRKITTAATRATLSVWLGMMAQAKPLPLPEQTDKGLSTEKADPSVPVEDEDEVEAVAVNTAPVAPPPVVNVQPQRPQQPVNAYYIGNKNSLKFHRNNCRFVPSPGNQVPFANRNEAVRQGYVPCRVCTP